MLRLFRGSTRVIWSLGCLFALGALAGPTELAFAQDAGGAQQAEPRRPREGRPDRPRRGDGPPSVEAAMKGMERAIAQLHDQISDASKKADNLRLVGEAQRACVGAKLQPPPEEILAKITDAAEKDKKKAAFHRHLVRALRSLVDIEEALMDGKPDAAAAHLEALIKTRDAAHTELGVEE
jgi:hypothetical protein